MTVAPELKGMRELALYCLSRNIVLQAGHTDATYENMMEGMQAGILHSTHFFNAMSRLHHRDPGAVGAITHQPRAVLRDHRRRQARAPRPHTAPHARQAAEQGRAGHRRAQADRAGTLPAATPTARKWCWRTGVFHRKTDGVIAGSCLTMIGGVRNLAWLGRTGRGRGGDGRAATRRASWASASAACSCPATRRTWSCSTRNSQCSPRMVGGRFVMNELG